MSAAAELFRENHGTPFPEERGIIALDDLSHEQSANLLEGIGPSLFHLAKENANAQEYGWVDAVKRNADLGYSLMADAKYHDTPRTMKSHILKGGRGGPQFITVHTLADVEALEAAAEGRDELRAELGVGAEDSNLVSLLGITVLTSHSEERCQLLFGMPVKEKVLQLAGFAVEANLEGIVCAGSDLAFLNRDPDIAKLIKVVPGIVLPGQEKGSGQSRTVTPREAIGEGADYLVAGSTVTKAANIREAAEQFVDEIAEAA